MRIAVTGVTGRLGSALVGILEREFEVVPLDRAALDLAAPGRLAEALAGHRFGLLIHPAAMTAPDAAELDPGLAMRVNGEAPGVLAAECRRRGVRMMHISTDYVFGGREPGLRSEEDPTEPVCVYGHSKLAGERAVLAADPSACVLRVSWLYGAGRPGFPETVIERARSGAPLEAIADKFSLPTRVADLTGWIRRLVDRPGVRGVVHACPSGNPASWHDWARVTLEAAVASGMVGRHAPLARQRLDECTFLRAARPRHSAMANDRLAGILGTAPPDWQQSLRDHVAALAADGSA